MSRPLLPRRRCPPWACKLRVSNPRREDNAINKNTMAEAASARGRVRLAGMSSRSKVASTARRIFDHQCKKAGGLKLFSASKCDPARLRSNVSWWRPDCLAGHVGLELRNVVAKYPFERSRRFPGVQPNSGHRDYSRLSCGVEETPLGPSARMSAAACGRWSIAEIAGI